MQRIARRFSWLRAGVVVLVVAAGVTGVQANAANAGPYLTAAKAKAVARARAERFDSRVEQTKVDWYNRWGTRQVDVGVTGSWTRSIYHSGCADGYFEGCADFSWTEHDDSECDATVTVKMNRSGYIWSRVSDKSCMYG